MKKRDSSKTSSGVDYSSVLITFAMSVYAFGFLLCFLAFEHTAYASLHLEVNPTHISQGLTSSLTITCTFSYVNLPSVSSIISLIISQADVQNNGPQNFVELASVTSFKPDQVTELIKHNASVSGQIDTSGESFLTLQWAYPTDAVSGVYVCHANVVDNVGHPVDLSSTTVQVTASKPELDDLIQTVQFLKSEMERQQKKQADLMAETFYVSSEYNGSIYLLSKHYTFNIDVAEVSCEHYGGYLAELDDQSEHEFVKSFLESVSSVNFTMVGATDEASEGKWIFRYSGKPMVYSDWYGNEPNTPGYDCMHLIRGYGWQMLDYPCYEIPYYDRHFLCEVPQL